MSQSSIFVFQDATLPDGGRAIIRFNGVAALAPGFKFRIESLAEPHGTAASADWPNGELSPIDMRQTSEGLEILVGPEIVDAPLLRPGVLVRISVPDAGIEGDVVWPAIPGSTGPRERAPLDAGAGRRTPVDRQLADAARILDVALGHGSGSGLERINTAPDAPMVGGLSAVGIRAEPLPPPIVTLDQRKLDMLARRDEPTEALTPSSFDTDPLPKVLSDRSQSNARLPWPDGAEQSPPPPGRPG